ncbi:MAG: amidase [Alphaproteobacteria bacterium]|jgi:aspartyl-tRNA(Asn)/glutamyl-tRNA(Gln) amidotransferase subunit A|nr:amidase [Alphaproteobacteria bacterium]HJP22438.1 amidase [Alphaproteobacteria bacterium]
MTDAGYAYFSISDLAPSIESGEISPVALVQTTLDRIAAHNDTLCAYITVMTESALDEAHQAERQIAGGNYLGPLHGVPLAAKDLFATAGVRTTFGSPLYADWVPDHDAAAVERLRAAGAVIVGKTNLHELAYGGTSGNPHFGAVRNAFDPACHPGGSSGGSATAVAGGLAFGALGSDTGASIRQPAACCGIVGLKPTFGLVSKFGALPLCWTMDHVGPMTRTVADAAAMLQVLAGYDERDETSAERPVPDYGDGVNRGAGGVRIALVREFFFADCDAEISAAVEAAGAVFEGLGARVEEATIPDVEVSYAAGTIIMGSEGAAMHGADLRQRPELFSDEVRGLLTIGGLYPAADYVQAQRFRKTFAAAVEELFTHCDALIMPTSPVPATPIDDSPPEHGPLRYRNTVPFDVSGHPAISLPCGFTAKGLPIGLQIVGRAFGEAELLAIAAAYEGATDWHERHPKF